MVLTPHANLAGASLHEDKRIKQPVRAASTANHTLTAPGATVDGVTMVAGDRMLLKNQTAAAENGLYIWNGAASTATRATDAAAAADFGYGFRVFVREGTAQSLTFWTMTQTAAITLNTTAITFAQSVLPVQSATAAVVATSGTITTSGVTIARVAPAGAVTGVILQAGAYVGQEVWVVNESAAASTVTFAAAGTSNVADGTSGVIAGLTAAKYLWNSAVSRWFRA